MGNSDFISVEFWRILITLINTLILFFIIKKFLYKPVMKMIEGRDKEIRESLEEAEQAQKKAGELKEHYETAMNGAKNEAAKIMQNAAETAEENAGRIIKEARDKSKEILIRADRDIEQEKLRAKDELKEEVGGLAVLLAAKIIEKELDEKDNDKLINEFIEKI